MMLGFQTCNNRKGTSHLVFFGKTSIQCILPMKQKYPKKNEAIPYPNNPNTKTGFLPHTSLLLPQNGLAKAHNNAPDERIKLPWNSVNPISLMRGENTGDSMDCPMYAPKSPRNNRLRLRCGFNG